MPKIRFVAIQGVTYEGDEYTLHVNPYQVKAIGESKLNAKTVTALSFGSDPGDVLHTRLSIPEVIELLTKE